MLYADVKKLLIDCKDENEMLRVYSQVSNYLQSLFIKESAGLGFYSRYATYAVVMGLSFDYSFDAPMWVSFDGEFHFNINPSVVFNITRCEEDILFIMAHEISHIINRDLVRYKDLFKDEVCASIANIATDVSINDYLKICTKSSMQEGMFGENLAKLLGVDLLQLLSSYGTDVSYKNNSGKVVLSDVGISLLTRRFEEMLGNSIAGISYNLKVSGTSLKDELKKESSGIHSDCFDISDKNQQDAKDFCNELSKVIDRVTPVTDGGYVEADVKDFEKLEKVVSNQLNVKVKGRSSIGNGLSSEYKFTSVKRQISWQSYIKVFLNNASRNKTTTKRRINRRQPFRLELSGKRVENNPKIYIAVDESGSITNKELNYFYTEMCSISSMFPNCTLVVRRFTAKVEEVREFTSKSFKRNFLDWIKNRYIGGTCFQPVFDELQSSKERVPKNSMLIMFTDGDGEKEIDPHGYDNVIWVISKSMFSEGYGLSCEKSTKGKIIPLVLQE